MSKFVITFLLLFSATFLAAQDNPKLQKAFDHHNAGELDEALALYSEVIDETPDAIAAVYNRGFIYYNKKDYSKAIPDMKKVLEAIPQQALAAAVIGDCYLNLLDFPAGKSYCKTAYELDSMNVYFTNNFGYALLLTGDAKKARYFTAKVARLFSNEEEYNNLVKGIAEYIDSTLNDASHKELASKELQFLKEEFGRVGPKTYEINSNRVQAHNLEYVQVKPAEAAPFYEKACRLAVDATLPDLIEYNYNNAVYTYEYVNDYKKSLEVSLFVYNSAKQKNLLSIVRKSASNLGKTYKELRDYEKSAQYLEEAVAIGKKLGNMHWVDFDLNELGQVYDFKGDVQKSVAVFNESLELKQKLGNKKDIPTTLNNLGSVYRKMGEFQKSIAAYEECIKLAQQGFSKDDLGLFKNGLGMTYADLGNFEKSLSLLQEALAFEEQQGNEENVNKRISNIGSLYSKMKEYGNALSWFKRSLELSKKLDDADAIGFAHHNVAASYSSLKQHDDAIENYKLAINSFKKINSVIGATLSELALIDVLVKLRQSPDIKEFLSRAEPIIRNENSKHYLIDFLEIKAGFFIRQARWSEVIVALEEAIEITETLRKNAKGEERKTYFGNMLHSYQVLGPVYIHSKVTGSAIKAFNVSELSRSKVLAERLSGNQSVAPPTVQTIQSQLNPNAALLNFFNGDFNMILQVGITKDKIEGFTTWTEDVTTQLVEKYQEEVNVALNNQRGMKLSKPKQDNIFSEKDQAMENLISYYRELLVSTGGAEAHGNLQKANEIGRALFDLLIKPYEPLLVGKDELIIIADGILNYLPFETLIDGNGKYLIEKYNVRYVQSATVLDLINKRNYPAERKPLLAFGGGVYDEVTYSTDMVDTEQELVQLEKATSGKIASRGSLRDSYALLGVAKWINLPGTLNEVQTLGKVVPGSIVISGADVSENKVKALSASGSLSQYKVIHFATHGLVVPAIPELSALVLSQFKAEQGGEDGYLRMQEIENLKLKADYVNLSACETGLGKIYGGEGVVGLTQSFLLAGANGLSVSLWQVADESTSQLMTGMYRLVQEQKITHAKALTEMKRKFIRGEFGELNKNPYFWAPFVYYGR